MNLDTSIIAAHWSQRAPITKNWGDKLNPYLINKITQRPVVSSHLVHGWGSRPVLRAIGSSLSSATQNEVVWGTGFIKEMSTLTSRPFAITAVRGPRTRRRLAELDVDCPDVFGDAAVLLPLVHRPRGDVTHDVGIIHHVREIDTIEPVRIDGSESVKRIDILGSIHGVVAEIVSCKRIISSSLHGIICAHAYGVQASWMKPSDLPLGDGFKFLDYFESVGKLDATPLLPDENGVIRAAQLDEDQFDPYLDPAALLAALPFLSEERRDGLLRFHKQMEDRGRRGTIFNRARET